MKSYPVIYIYMEIVRISHYKDSYEPTGIMDCHKGLVHVAHVEKNGKCWLRIHLTTYISNLLNCLVHLPWRHPPLAGYESSAAAKWWISQAHAGGESSMGCVHSQSPSPTIPQVEGDGSWIYDHDHGRGWEPKWPHIFWMIWMNKHDASFWPKKSGQPGLLGISKDVIILAILFGFSW